MAIQWFDLKRAISLRLYDLGIILYSALIHLSAWWQPKAAQWIAGRKAQQYPSISHDNPTHTPRFWVHCASLGEFEQGRPLIEALRRHYPQCRIWLTFYSPSGYTVRHRYELADWVGYLPLDTATNARQLIDALRPTAVFWVKYEFWRHYLATLHARGIPAYLISAQFTATQIFFQAYGGFFRQILPYYRHIFVQNPESAQLLLQIGIEHVSVSGDTRFDRVASIADQAPDLPLIALFRNAQPLLIAGSTWKPDEAILLRYIAQQPAELSKFIIVPHEIDEAHIAALCRQLNLALDGAQTPKPEITDLPRVLRYSEILLEDTAWQTAVLPKAQILVIDRIGLLAALYRYADYAYVGGGFGRGIHNILEAAVWGIPIFFGSRYSQFREAVDLVELQTAFSLNNADTLRALIGQYPPDSAAYRQIAQITRQYIRQHVGATSRIMAQLNL
jgi:3-deoxy-D-manno-octulosonic-acid transferase